MQDRTKGTSWVNFSMVNDLGAGGVLACEIHLRIVIGSKTAFDKIEATYSLAANASGEKRSLKEVKDLLKTQLKEAGRDTDQNVALVEALQLPAG